MTRKGCAPYKLISAASTNATSVKAAAARLLAYDIGNSNAAARYVKFYNKATAPTVGTDVPVMTIMIPAGRGKFLALPDFAFFPAGLGLAITANMADTDASAVGANDVVVNLLLE